MKWKYVFNTTMKFSGGVSINVIVAFVKTTGYKFFTFNGTVCDLQGEDIGLTVKDLF